MCVSLFMLSIFAKCIHLFQSNETPEHVLADPPRFSGRDKKMDTNERDSLKVITKEKDIKCPEVAEAS